MDICAVRGDSPTGHVSGRNEGHREGAFMNVIRGVTAFLICAGLAAVGFASPARADDFGGTYTIDLGGSTATWTVTPCDPQPFIPCAYISETGGETQPWQGKADLGVGYWTMFVERPDVLSCDDGQKFPAKTTYSWNAATLVGYISIFNPGLCGNEVGTLSAPFALAKVAPPLPAEAPAPAPAPASAEA